MDIFLRQRPHFFTANGSYVVVRINKFKTTPVSTIVDRFVTYPFGKLKVLHKGKVLYCAIGGETVLIVDIGTRR